MTWEPEAVREVHKIRERLYEEQKDLSVQELVELYERELQEAVDKHGLKVQPLPKDQLKRNIG